MLATCEHGIVRQHGSKCPKCERRLTAIRADMVRALNDGTYPAGCVGPSKSPHTHPYRYIHVSGYVPGVPVIPTRDKPEYEIVRSALDSHNAEMNRRHAPLTKGSYKRKRR